MSYKYNINPDFYPACEFLEPVAKMDQEGLNVIVGDSIKAWEENESDDKIKVTKMEIPSFDGASIKIQILEPHELAEPAPCLIYYHGGAYMFPSLTYHINFVREYALKIPCKVVCVEYRLAPEYLFPVAHKDCYETLIWVHDNAAKLGINPDKIAVGGDSAGGNLTGAMALMSRDQNGPKIAGQMLIYPLTDVTQSTESMKSFVDTPGWNSVLNNGMLETYLKNGDSGMRCYLSLIEADSLSGLPKAYVETAEFDPLRDEGRNYAHALKAAGVDAEHYQADGTIHAFDMVMDSPITKRSFEKRIAFLKEIFS